MSDNCYCMNRSNCKNINAYYFNDKLEIYESKIEKLEVSPLFLTLYLKCKKCGHVSIVDVEMNFKKIYKSVRNVFNGE